MIELRFKLNFSYSPTVEKVQSLAEYLGTAAAPADAEPRLIDISDPMSFAAAVLNSREFRSYIVNSLVLGTIPPAVLLRVMDLAGWQKPPERVEHTGRDGEPIEVITRIVRVIVDPSHLDEDEHAVVH